MTLHFCLLRRLKSVVDNGHALILRTNCQMDIRGVIFMIKCSKSLITLTILNGKVLEDDPLVILQANLGSTLYIDSTEPCTLEEKRIKFSVLLFTSICP